MDTQEEYKLISRVILYDDHKAFEALIGMHQNGIKNLLLKLLNFNESELDDLFQETCTKVYRNIKSFKGKSSFSTWIYKITYNTFLNSIKKKNRYRLFKSKLPINTPLNSENKQNNKMDLETMITILRPEEKVALQLSYIQGFSHKDISLILDCPVGTVKSLIKRGKERIANQYKTYKS